MFYLLTHLLAATSLVRN